MNLSTQKLGIQTFGLLLSVIAFLATAPLHAQAIKSTIPLFVDPHKTTTSGSTTPIRTIRFLTTNDFPPFNFIGPDGRLTGFNVSIARELCLEIKARCTLQALPWNALSAALQAGQGDAIVAGIAMSDKTLRLYNFTAPYLRLPARFFTAKNTEEPEAFKGPQSQVVGVESGSAHEAYLKQFFPETPRKTYQDLTSLRQAVKEGSVPLGFGDGLSTSFWLQSGGAKDCCDFIGGPYINSDFFGAGLSIAVPIERPDLKKVLDDGLGRLSRKGKYSEIYLRSFPINFF